MIKMIVNEMANLVDPSSGRQLFLSRGGELMPLEPS